MKYKITDKCGKHIFPGNIDEGENSSKTQTKVQLKKDFVE